MIMYKIVSHNKSTWVKEHDLGTHNSVVEILVQIPVIPGFHP